MFMLPMRSIPFKVVCLIGMHDAAFPRASLSGGMDLMSKRRELGDRSRRDDDKYIFLETLLAAKERLYISYAGQSPETLKASPPSVLVSSLIDALNSSFSFSSPRWPPGLRLRASVS